MFEFELNGLLLTGFNLKGLTSEFLKREMNLHAGYQTDRSITLSLKFRHGQIEKPVGISFHFLCFALFYFHIFLFPFSFPSILFLASLVQIVL